MLSFPIAWLSKIRLAWLENGRSSRVGEPVGDGKKRSKLEKGTEEEFTYILTTQIQLFQWRVIAFYYSTFSCSGAEEVEVMERGKGSS